MTRARTASRFPFRLIVWSIGLTLMLLASTGGGTAASTLIPMADTGGSGGGGGASGTLDETDRALALIATSDTSVTAVPAFAPTANERSIQLVESTYAPGGYLAGGTAPPVRAAYEDSEHAMARSGGAGEAPVTVQRTGVLPS